MSWPESRGRVWEPGERRVTAQEVIYETSKRKKRSDESPVEIPWIFNVINHFTVKWLFEQHYIQFSSVQFIRSVMSNSLRPHESQHARPPCPSPSPGVHSNSCPSSRWCHPTISSSVIYYLDAKEDKTKVAEKWYHRKSKRYTNPCVQVYYK